MITGATSVYGIIGNPVSHSLSPVFQNRAYDYLGLDAVYVPFLVQPDALAEALEGLSRLGVKGVNVTVPFKELVVPLLHEVTEMARQMGAVNTIQFKGDHWVGTNTDGDGFWNAMMDLGLSSEITCGIVGSGGSARAIAVGYASRGGKKLRMVNRTLEKAHRLKRDIQAVYPLLDCEVASMGDVGILQGCDLVVNTTSVGLGGGSEGLMDMGWVNHGQVVGELTYGAPSGWLEAAKARGGIPFNGRGMLLHQGILSIEFWTGKRVPMGVCEEGLRGFAP